MASQDAAARSQGHALPRARARQHEQRAGRVPQRRLPGGDVAQLPAEGVMGKNTGIEWTDHSWPVVNGCRRVSPGCGGASGIGGCYAERLISTRLRHMPKYRGLAVFGQHGPRWTGESRLWLPDLDMPLRVRTPARFFVANMGDLFFEAVTNEEIAAVYGVMTA